MMAAIMVTHRREYFHAWPDAPAAVEFLSNKHRHEFHIKLTLPVAHSDRDKEFFLVQSWLKEALDQHVGVAGADLGSSSCEDIATTIVQEAAQHFDCDASCEVWEDGENGAAVTGR